MIIPDTIALHCEDVLVFNYRSKKWEEGTICKLSYEYSFNSWSWSYDVLTKREAMCGRVRLYVDNNWIKKLSDANALLDEGVKE